MRALGGLSSVHPPGSVPPPGGIPPPAESTLPSGNRAAVEWYILRSCMLAIVDHVSVAGSHISAASIGWLASWELGALVPPVTSTFPSGRIVALRRRRAKAIEATYRHRGN